jgi:hypothetical protein
MIQTWKHISIVFLAFLYLTAASGTLIAQLSMPAVASGPVELKGLTGTTKEPCKPVWTTRRYVPMVKEVSTPSIHIGNAPIFSDLDGYTILQLFIRFHQVHSFYFSSLSDRAPPLS